MPPAIVPYRGGSRRLIADITCPTCSKTFRPKGRTQRYCSPACFHTAHGERMKGRPLGLRAPRDDCPICGKQVKRAGKKYCSEDCYDKTKIGRLHSEESRRKMRATQTAVWAPRRDPARRAEMKRVRMSQEWKDWRKAVFERDDYRCRECGDRCCQLEPHHIKKFADHPELVFDVDNGLTLCRPCHLKTENYGNRKSKAEN